MLDDTDKEVIRLIQGDIPVSRRPFAEMAEKIGIREDDFLRRVRELKHREILRRFGATLRHQEAGFRSNAMVAWRVPREKVERVGGILAGFREVTHCYERMPQKDWPYNLYSMIHGSSREQCEEIAIRMSKAAGIEDYAILFSEREFKKTSMSYF